METQVLTLIIPDEKDIERAKDMYNRQSRDQMGANIRRIKDPLKVAKRYVAYTQISGFTHSDFEYHLIHLVGKESELYKQTMHTLQVLNEERKRKEEAKAQARLLVERPARDVIDTKVLNAISKWNRNKILNTLYLNKKCFGDRIRIANVDITFNEYLGFNEHTPIRVIVNFEHLDGYFFREMNYSLDLILDVRSDGTSHFKRNGSHRTIFRIGKKDTNTLMLVVENLKNQNIAKK